jgi:hypothetical protein
VCSDAYRNDILEKKACNSWVIKISRLGHIENTVVAIVYEQHNLHLPISAVHLAVGMRGTLPCVNVPRISALLVTGFLLALCHMYMC